MLPTPVASRRYVSNVGVLLLNKYILSRTGFRFVAQKLSVVHCGCLLRAGHTRTYPNIDLCKTQCLMQIPS